MTKALGAGNVGDMNGSSSAMDPSSSPLKALAVALVVVAAFIYAFVPVRACNDVWWHLKTGKLIVEAGGRLPVNDTFTFTGENIRWYNHEWLAQAVFYKIFQWGGGAKANLIGLRMLIAFVSFATAATFLLVFLVVQQRCRCMPLAALITLLALDVSRHNLYLRPPVFTYLFLAVFLLILDNWKSRRWPRLTLVALPLTTILWANLHGGFIVGLLLVGFYLAGEIAEHLLWKKGKSEENDPDQTTDSANDFKPRLVWLGGTMVACLLGSLCTPYHYHLYELYFRVMRSSVLVKMIPELHSPFGPDVARYYLSFFIMAGLIVATMGIVRAANPKRPPAADLFILLFFGYESVRHIRHLPLFAIATAPILGWTAGQLLDRAGEQLRRRAAWLATAATVLLAFYCIGCRSFPETYWNRNAALASGVTYIEINYPKDVCDFIVMSEFEGRMFNPINCAGFLIWRLSPEVHKVFTDNRFDVFGDRFVWDEAVVSQGIERDFWEKMDPSNREGRHIRERCGSAGWSDILDRWKINFVIAERPWAVREKLRASGQWESVFHWIKPFEPREGYEIFVRRTEGNRELISRCKRYVEQMQAFERGPF